MSVEVNETSGKGAFRRQLAEEIGIVKAKLDLACLVGIPKSIKANS